VRDLTIDELILALDDLLGKRGPELAKLSSGKSFRTLLSRIRGQLAALPEALRGLPRAELLRALDLNHDRRHRALSHLRQAIELWPDATAAMKRAAALLASDFVVEASETQAPYAVEAQKAEERLLKLPAAEPVLAAVSTPDGSTLVTWVRAFLEAGRTIGTTLSGRADDLATRPDGKQAGALRGTTIGLLSDLRTTVARELEADTDATLPRSLDADIFGYVDELQRLAAARASNASNVAAPAGPTNPVPPVGPNPT